MDLSLTDDLELSDSGMESLTASKDDTPERKPEDNMIIPVISTPGDAPSVAESPATESGGTQIAMKSRSEFDDEPDETLPERLWGLTEMFPEGLRNATYSVSSNALSGVKTMYGVSRSLVWIIASSSVVLFAPVIFEVERAQVDEMQKSQQKQVLLGTNAALTGQMPSMPTMPR